MDIFHWLALAVVILWGIGFVVACYAEGVFERRRRNRIAWKVWREDLRNPIKVVEGVWREV